DNIYGYVPDVKEWTGSLEKANVISLNEFKEILKTNHTQVVDLRGSSEYKAGHVKGADHVFIGTLEKNLSKIKKDQQVIIHCQAGDRASIGYSLLAKHGFKNIKNYSGGINEWVNTGNAVVTEN
ncbi:MAG TPA: rhodanese-like domain-containing protein, partial [Cyclobacteriaceae bacterium]|nr:rhodanese-like domain-containing protein [Cyclobacteriaceae bacterium]